MLATVQGLGGAAFFGGGSPLGLDAVVFGDVAIAAPKVHSTFYPSCRILPKRPQAPPGVSRGQGEGILDYNVEFEADGGRFYASPICWRKAW